MDPLVPSGYITLNDTYALGLHSSVVLSGTQTNTIRCGMQAGSPGDLTIDISLCRATGHDQILVQEVTTQVTIPTSTRCTKSTKPVIRSTRTFQR